LKHAGSSGDVKNTGGGRRTEHRRKKGGIPKPVTRPRRFAGGTDARASLAKVWAEKGRAGRSKSQLLGGR